MASTRGSATGSGTRSSGASDRASSPFFITVRPRFPRSHRTALDQIGIGIAWDQAAPPPANPPDARDEWVVEAYWAWTFFKGFQITPDLQFYVHPALNPGQGNARVFSLRGLVLF